MKKCIPYLIGSLFCFFGGLAFAADYVIEGQGGTVSEEPNDRIIITCQNDCQYEIWNFDGLATMDMQCEPTESTYIITGKLTVNGTMYEKSRSCECIPDCSGRQCGSDGCGGTCGECEARGEFCDVKGVCSDGIPECWIDFHNPGAKAGEWSLVPNVETQGLDKTVTVNMDEKTPECHYLMKIPMPPLGAITYVGNLYYEDELDYACSEEAIALATEGGGCSTFCCGEVGDYLSRCDKENKDSHEYMNCEIVGVDFDLIDNETAKNQYGYDVCTRPTDAEGNYRTIEQFALFPMNDVETNGFTIQCSGNYVTRYGEVNPENSPVTNSDGSKTIGILLDDYGGDFIINTSWTN